MVQQYITDETGKKLAVILPINEYEKMLERLEEMKKITKSPALPNHNLTDDELLEIVLESEEQIKNGNCYTMGEVDEMIQSWKKK